MILITYTVTRVIYWFYKPTSNWGASEILVISESRIAGTLIQQLFISKANWYLINFINIDFHYLSHEIHPELYEFV